MIEKLEFLLAVARERNFRRAAEACGVAQPTLSAGIKSLEQTLGVLLIRRSSRFQELTPEGERVLEWARRLAGDARSMRQEVQAMRHGLTGELRLGVIPTALPYTPAITQPYRRYHPGMRITVLPRSSNEILEQLDGLRLDAGLTYVSNEMLGRLRSIPLYTERYTLITGASSPLAGCHSVSWAEIGALPLCLFTPDMQNRRILDRLLWPSGGPAKPCIVESDSTMALLAHVRDGDLSTVVSEQVASLLAGAEPFRAIPITGAEAAFLIGLVVPDRQPLPPILRALVEVAGRLAIPRH